MTGPIHSNSSRHPARPRGSRRKSSTVPTTAMDRRLEDWQEPGPYDPGSGVGSYPDRREAGKKIRKRVPREAHAEWKPAANRPGPVSILQAGDAERQSGLLPLRAALLGKSPFNFLRGSAAVMAWDLARTPTTALPVILDGDAHLANFGLFGSPQGDVVFDLNDFDETAVGSWEWDLKRLAASVCVAARQNDYPGRKRRRAVMSCVQAYRENAGRLQNLGVMDVWYQHAFPQPHHSLVKRELQTHKAFKEAVLKAADNTSKKLLPEIARRARNGRWRFIEHPPRLKRVADATAAAIESSLGEYVDSLASERRFMMNRYRLADVVQRVVGVGSVGARTYLALLFGAGEDDPLFWQFKQALRPASAAPSTASARALHDGRRVVLGQRFLQANSDVLLGWTTIEGRPFYVRQARNLKGSLPLKALGRSAFDSYVWACGALLARAHARTGDIAAIAGYCGDSEALDSALADFAEAYADQTESDHQAWQTAIKDGQVKSASRAQRKKYES
jgi:uncharacterized protein (DUF2252 family)